MKHEKPIYLFASLKQDPRYWMCCSAVETERDRVEGSFTLHGNILSIAPVETYEDPVKIYLDREWQQDTIEKLPFTSVWDSYFIMVENEQKLIMQIHMDFTLYNFDFYPTFPEIIADHFVELM